MATGMKILIADDDSTSLLLLEAKLNDWGYQVIICKNGKTILVGIMEVASLVSIKPNDHYFGIRFKRVAF